MTVFVDRKSRTDIMFTLRTQQNFTARDVAITDDVAKKIFDHQAEAVVIQEYLQQCYDLTSRQRNNGDTPTTPALLKSNAKATRKPKTVSKESGV